MRRLRPTATAGRIALCRKAVIRVVGVLAGLALAAGTATGVAGAAGAPALLSGVSAGAAKAAPAAAKDLAANALDPGDAFTCTTPTFFLTQQRPITVASSTLYTGTLGAGTGDINELRTIPFASNGLGFNPKDNFLYSITRGSVMGGPSNHLLQTGEDGQTVDLGPVMGLPEGMQYTVGAFDPDGNYYVTSAGVSNTVWRIDVNPGGTSTATAIPLVGAPMWPTLAADFAYSDGFFWAIDPATHHIYRWDPSTGVLTPFTIPAGVEGGPNDQFGAAWTFGNGNLGFQNNDTGVIYQIHVTDGMSATPEFTTVGPGWDGPITMGNDGASCTSPDNPDLLPDLAIHKDGPAHVGPGGTVTWMLTVTNNGPGNSSGFVVTDTVPAEFTDVASETQGCAVTDDNVVQCAGGALGVGDMAHITITATAPSTSDTFTNVANVLGNEPDPFPDNNEDTSMVTVDTPPTTSVDLAINKSGPAEVAPNGMVTWNLTVTNNGPDDSTGFVVEDAVPPEFTQVATDTEGCMAAGNDIQCVGGPLAVGDSTHIVVTATAPPTAGRFLNTATVNGNEPDPIPDNNESTAGITIDTPPPASSDLSITKVGLARIDAGGTATWTIRVTNNGPDPSTGFVVTDGVPDGFTNVATTTEGCAANGNVVECTGIALAVNSSAEITLTALATTGGTFRNVAMVTGNEPDHVEDNNEASVTTTIVGTLPPGAPQTGTAAVGNPAAGMLLGMGVVLGLAGLAASGLVLRRRRRFSLAAGTGGKVRRHWRGGKQ